VGFGKKHVIVDTGYFVALLRDNDDHHKVAATWDYRHSESYDLVTTDFVIQEVFQLLMSRVNYKLASNFIDSFPDLQIGVLPFPTDWPHRISKILRKFNDHKLDLADASLVVLADHIGAGEILTVDVTDFSYLRWRDGKECFKNLLYPDQ
jgi:predicted nucleic acid-binding protein